MLRVSASRVLIGEGASQEGHQGDHTLPRRGVGPPTPRRGLAVLVRFSVSSSGLRVPHGKILTLAFVPSNFENIDFLPFWNQK